MKKLFLLCTACFLLLGCQQQMAEQPSYRPLQPSSFFDDGRASRPLVPGTVARDVPLEDPTLLTGRRHANADAARAAALIGLGRPVDAAAQAGAQLRPEEEYVTEFPFAITYDDLRRGQERYTIYCAVCHDPVGTGRGKIVERGYVMPPSYLTGTSRGLERRGFKVLLRDAPVGYYFEVVSLGYGAMPDYAEQVKPADRWRIIAYVRALQLSQRAPVNLLPEEEREKAQK